MKAKASPADALRSVPPREFIQARNALAAQLTKRGKAAEARQVARLRRPTPVVWALNHAAIDRPRELATLIETVDRLRRAQLGQGDLQAAMEGYRGAFEPLVRAANQVLREAEIGVSPALDRRIRSTLLAAVTDRGLRGELGAGRLAQEHTDPGFAVLSRGPMPAGFLAARPTRRPSSQRVSSPPRPSAKPSRSAGSSAEAAAALRREAREQARATRQATRETRSLALRAERAERAAQRVERRAATVRRTLAALDERGAKLRAEADRARTRLTSAGEQAAPPRPVDSSEARSRTGRSRADRR